MTILFSQVSTKGQMVIPAELREALDLKAGTKVALRLEGNTIVLRIPLTHQAISDMIGAARPTVSSALGNFRRQGVLSFNGHRIRIENEALLHKVAYR